MIARIASGRVISRETLYLEILKANDKQMFGKFSGAHLTTALKELIEGPNPIILKKTGAPSEANTEFTFRVV